MSRIFYRKYEWKYLLVLCLALLPGIGICQDTAMTVDDYFNEGANKYINNKNTEALRLVQKGLSIDSSDEKLKKLAELILKKDKQKQKQQQQQQQQNKQDQDKDQDKDKNKDNQNNKQDQQKEQQKEQNNQLTKEDAERMLDALNNKDKDLQDKLNDKKDSAAIMRSKVEKDW